MRRIVRPRGRPMNATAPAPCGFPVRPSAPSTTWRRRNRAIVQEADQLDTGRGEVFVQTIKEASTEFLASKRIAVTGVSRTPKAHAGNAVYQRLRQRGYEVFAVNPNAKEVEGDPSYPSLSAIPGGVEAVVIATRPEVSEETMRECAELGIQRVWMHRGPGAGSVSTDATRYGREHGITVIDGGCPCMFDPTADAGHKLMRFALTLTGSVPRRI